MGLAERENKRKSVISTITSDKNTEKEENNGRIQRSYYIDADIVTALKIKAAREGKKMTDVVNEILDKLINFDKNTSDTEAETISFDQDAPYIYAAFRQAYGIDLFKEQGKLQWWEFVSLLGALPSDTRLSDIIDIRTRPVPAPNGRNQEQISALLKLKAQYAIKNPVNKQSAQDGWERLWGTLEKQAEER